MKLLDNKSLEKSSVIANSQMNRERNAFGANSYEKEIAINPLTFLRERIKNKSCIRWLDICCGRGNALIQVAEELRKESGNHKFFLTGIDIANEFATIPTGLSMLGLIESPLEVFDTDVLFDLITCVHGMHYIGDKLGVIQKYIRHLKSDGLFICNMDTNDIFEENGRKLNRKINAVLRNQGLHYDSRKKYLKCRGKIEINLPFRYVGANDKYGRNYTRQHTVSSYYSLNTC